MAFISGTNRDDSALELNSDELLDFSSTPAMTKIPEEESKSKKDNMKATTDDQELVEDEIEFMSKGSSESSISVYST